MEALKQEKPVQDFLQVPASCLEIVYSFTKESVNLQCLSLVCELGNIHLDMHRTQLKLCFVSCSSDVWIQSSQEN